MNALPDYAELHAPYADLLRAALAAASPQSAHYALDLACGTGLKTPWLRDLLAPQAQLVGIDCVLAALRQAKEHVTASWLAADAHTLPLGDATIDLAWCVASFGLFAQPAQVLGELRRVLRPGGTLVLSVVTQRWVRLRNWPAALSAALEGPALPAPADGLGEDLADMLAAAGYGSILLNGYLLEPHGGAMQQAALPLLSWGQLQPLVAQRLSASELAACAEAEADAEPEPMPIMLVLAAQNT